MTLLVTLGSGKEIKKISSTAYGTVGTNVTDAYMEYITNSATQCI